MASQLTGSAVTGSGIVTSELEGEKMPDSTGIIFSKGKYVQSPNCTVGGNLIPLQGQ